MDDVLPFGDDDLLNELDTEPVLVVTAYDSVYDSELTVDSD
jgi:hypothetical protein